MSFFILFVLTLQRVTLLSELARRNMAADLIGKIISMQCFDVESFELYNCDWFESSIPKWLLRISLSRVECVDLKCGGVQMELSEAIFSCVTLTSLSLNNFKMTKVPPLFQGFPHLETLYLEHVELSEESFEAISKLGGLLQSLTVSECGLPTNLRLVSSNLKSLALFGLDCYHCSMEANCPRLEIFKISYCGFLEMVNMCLPECVHLETDYLKLLQFGNVNSVKKIACFGDPSFDCPKLLQSFSHLEQLCIDYPLFFCYPNVIGELTLQLTSLKIFTVNIRSYDIYFAKDDEMYVVAFMFWSCVMEGSPMLEAVRICMDYRPEESGSSRFDVALGIVNDFQSFARDLLQINISVSRRIVSPGRL